MRLMTEMNTRKIRPKAVWAEVRKAWEGGETARSVAKRYDVGVPALWKRREAEGWRRPDPKAGPVEPAEGWDMHARRKLDAWEQERDEARAVAAALAEAMAGGPLENVPVWHAGFVLRWRAEHLPPETAARDREWAVGRGGWLDAFWDADGRLSPLDQLDRITMRHNRAEWRAHAGLPEWAAETWP